MNATVPSADSYATAEQIRFLHANAIVSIVGALVANVTLVLLLWRVRIAQVRRYALVLAVNSAADIAVTVILILQRQHPAMDDDRLFIFTAGPLIRLPGAVGFYLSPFLCSFMLVHMNLSPPLFFIYRYRMLVRGKSTPNKAIFAYYATNVLLSSAQAAIFLTALVINQADSNSACENFYRKLPSWRPTAADYENCVSIRQTDPLLAVSIVLSVIFSMFALAVMIYCTVCILRYVRKNAAQMSVQTRKLQRQLNVVLMIQIALPLLLEYIPFVVAPLSIRFGSASTISLFLSGATLSWLPFLSPTTTILMIGPYRRTVLDTLAAVSTLALRGRKKLSESSSKATSTFITPVGAFEKTG